MKPKKVKRFSKLIGYIRRDVDELVDMDGVYLDPREFRDLCKLYSVDMNDTRYHEEYEACIDEFTNNYWESLEKKS